MLEVEHGAVILPFSRGGETRSIPRLSDDPRFRMLLGEQAWSQLPAAIRARFGKHIGNGQSVAYEGEIVECRMSRLGWLLAHGPDDLRACGNKYAADLIRDKILVLDDQDAGA